MKKILKVVNVGYLQNRFAQDIIQENNFDGWGIDAMVEDSRRDTWITFYRYEEEKIDIFGRDKIEASEC